MRKYVTRSYCNVYLLYLFNIDQIKWNYNILSYTIQIRCYIKEATVEFGHGLPQPFLGHLANSGKAR